MLQKQKSVVATQIDYLYRVFTNYQDQPLFAVRYLDAFAS